jgi:TM2 domain-containing membrane protein YozV
MMMMRQKCILLLLLIFTTVIITSNSKQQIPQQYREEMFNAQDELYSSFYRDMIRKKYTQLLLQQHNYQQLSQQNQQTELNEFYDSTSDSMIDDRTIIIVNDKNQVIEQTVMNTTSDMQCSEISNEFIDCDFDNQCIMGLLYETNCTVKNITFNSTDIQTNDTIIISDYIVDCKGSKSFLKNYTCNYCWQLKEDEHYTCEIPNQQYFKKMCHASGQDSYLAICSANSNVACMGNRVFFKIKTCNYSTGYKWSHAVLYSIFLGGFGADRFYLRDIGYGFFKLLSLGGLGVWALVDVLLLLCGYMGPADGSVFY